jgi:hypothetical protein
MRNLPNTVQLLIAHPDIDVNEDYFFSSIRSTSVHPRPALFAALNQRQLMWVNQIIAHPRFDPIRSNVPSAIFYSIESDDFPGFTALLGNNLTLRGPTGESLLAAAIRGGGLEFMEHIRDHPAFNFAQQRPEQLLWAAATPAFATAVPFLLTLPGIDLNAPLPQHLNLFTRDIPRASATYRYDVFTEGGVSPRSGHPVLFSVPSLRRFSWRQLLNCPRLDLDQRGRHGQTILFEWTTFNHHAWWLACHGKLGLNLTDRHDNSALICALIARSSLISAFFELPFDATVRNMNGDTVWELLNDRVKSRERAA